MNKPLRLKRYFQAPNCSCLCSSIPAVTAYGVYNIQLILYPVARVLFTIFLINGCCLQAGLYSSIVIEQKESNYLLQNILMVKLAYFKNLFLCASNLNVNT